MNFLSSLKKVVEIAPASVTRPLVRVPFSVRLGRQYVLARRQIDQVALFSDDELQRFVFSRVHQLVAAALASNPFYQQLYRTQGIDLRDLRSFDDLASLPVVTKANLQEWSIRERSTLRRGAMRTNTGGTSGQTLDFYLPRSGFATEWAHMHHIWSHLGYRPTDLKLTFRGRNLGHNALRYNAVNNEFLVNTYFDRDQLVAAILKLVCKRRVAFLHGYPSAIFDFAQYLSTRRPDVASAIRANLKGILLASEFPAPPYRSKIEKVFGAPTMSWYGHSEMAVLAYEASRQFEYSPLQSYGYAEAVAASDGTFRLVGTSYSNMISPFIRYDTGDLILPEVQSGILTAFRISEGRVGEFIFDAKGQRISLTSLIFGRHHRMFDRARFVQVRQAIPGKATILVTVDDVLDTSELAAEFDLKGVDIGFDFELRAAPVRSATGKVPLLVKNEA